MLPEHLPCPRIGRVPAPGDHSLPAARGSGAAIAGRRRCSHVYPETGRSEVSPSGRIGHVDNLLGQGMPTSIPPNVRYRISVDERIRLTLFCAAGGVGTDDHRSVAIHNDGLIGQRLGRRRIDCAVALPPRLAMRR